MKVLFITHARIGDAVLSTGLLEWMRQNYRGVRLTVVCGPDSVDLFQGMPGVERVIAMPLQRLAGHWLRLWPQVAATRWSLIVDLRSSMITLFLLAMRRRGQWLPPSSGHRVQQMGMLFRQIQPPAPRLYSGAEHHQAAAAALNLAGPFLALAPAASWRGKVWPADRFVAAASRLCGAEGALAGIGAIVLLSAPGEEAMTRPVAQGLREHGHAVIDLSGRLHLLTAHAVLRRCAFFIGNETALMHIAAAARIPTLGLFGPSRETLYAPWGQQCAWVRTPFTYEQLLDQRRAQGPDADISYMTGLEVDAVVAAAEALIARLTEEDWQPPEEEW